MSEAVGRVPVEPTWRPTERTDPGTLADWTSAHPVQSSHHMAHWFRLLEAGTLQMNAKRRRLAAEIREFDQCRDATGRDHYLQAILHLARDLAL